MTASANSKFTNGEKSNNTKNVAATTTTAESRRVSYFLQILF